jgi:hypothetical protein
MVMTLVPRSEPRSGDTCIAWGVSPRNRTDKNQKAPEGRQIRSTRFVRSARACRPSGADVPLLMSTTPGLTCSVSGDR